MVAFLKAPLAGIPGRVSRAFAGEATESRLVSGTNTPSSYGVAVKLDASGNVTSLAAGDTQPVIAGILAQSFPFAQRSGGDSAGFGAATPVANTYDNVTVSGYVNVPIATAGGNPVAGATVFVQLVAEAGYVVGQFRTNASATAANTLALTNAKWASNGSAANGVGEVAFNV